MSRQSSIRVVALAALVVLAGCAGLGGTDDAGDQSDYQVDADGGATQGASEQSGVNGQPNQDAADVPNVQDRDRAIIREGTMRVEVDDFGAARASITARANELGGFVGQSNQRLDRGGDRERRSGYVVVRVPADEYETMQEAVSEEGTVVEERTETTDVSDQLVDLEARIDNLEQRRDRLRTFYDRANSTEELLHIERELSEVQGEIERLEAEQRSLERRVAYSTLRIEIHEPHPGESAATQYHERSLVGAFLGSVEDVVVLARAGLVTAAAAAPWLLAFAAPVGGLYWAVCRRRSAGRSDGASDGAGSLADDERTPDSESEGTDEETASDESEGTDEQ